MQREWRLHGGTDIAKKLDDDENTEIQDGEVAVHSGEYLFHNSRSTEEDGIDDHLDCAEWENNTQGSIDNELEQGIVDAAKEGLSDQGQQMLRDIVNEQRNMFWWLLVSDALAIITPVKFNLDKTKKRVWLKFLCYPKEKRYYLNRYIMQLVKLGLMILDLTAWWQAALHWVKKATSKYRRTFNLWRLQGLCVQ